MKKIFSLFLILIFFSPSYCLAKKKSYEEALTLQAFIQAATKNDTVFEEILIDELFLKNERDLRLPINDLVASVRGGYEFFLDQDREEVQFNTSLSKLFPKSGTEIEFEYDVNPTFSSGDRSPSDISFSFSQSILKDSFGRSTRLLDKVVGLEIDVSIYEIVEAYEIYLASLMGAYYDWYAAYENLQIAESSYEENLKLLENIQDRQKSNIALPIDVNKIKLQVLDKKETLISFQEKYESTLTVIQKAIRDDTGLPLKPIRPDIYDAMEVSFQKDFHQFQEKGRTFEMLQLLELKSEITLDRDIDSLLPSVNLLFDYDIAGSRFDLDKDEDEIFAGASVAYPFGQQLNQANKKNSEIQLEKSRLQTSNTYHSLYVILRNLFLSLEKEKDLGSISDEKLELAKSILEDETENYTLGKVDLNDYIQAVNVYDSNRFNRIARDVTYQKLMVEWLQLTDQIVKKEDLSGLS